MRPLLLAAVIVSVLSAGWPAAAGTIAPDLERRLVDAGPDETVPVVVLMDEFPALPELLRDVRGFDREQMENFLDRSNRILEMLGKDQDKTD